MKPVVVSIIVPSYKSKEKLFNLIDSIFLNKHFDSKYFEVIVVYNEEYDSVNLKEYRKTAFIYCPKRGSYAARNSGVKKAKGEYLAFMDDDCLVTDLWFERVLDITIKGEKGIFGGKIQPYDIKKPNIFSLYDGVFSMDQRFYIEHLGFAATANLFVDRATFHSVGFFCETLISGGDLLWGRRAGKGHPMVYGPKLLLMHQNRRSFWELIKKCIRTTAGEITVKKKLKKSVFYFTSPITRFLAFKRCQPDRFQQLKSYPIYIRSQILLLFVFLYTTERCILYFCLVIPKLASKLVLIDRLR